MRLRRGDVVLLAFPFSSGAGGKVRPALVVQCDPSNRRLTNVIVAMITTTTHRARRANTQLLIELETQAGKASGLLHTSAVTCENLLTVEQKAVHRVIGSLPATTMRAVDACLRASLGLR